MTPLQSLVASGTKLWLDSIDPDLVKRDRQEGATGATSNPVIISDLIKTGRFHIVDITTNAFVAYLPLALLGASPVALAWVVIVNGIGGLLQHANVRLPTPAWLDALVCTPAVHWRHHSRALADDGDFATMCMLIDRALGTWAPTHGRRPAALGLEQDPLPPGWLASLLAPLSPRRLVR